MRQLLVTVCLALWTAGTSVSAAERVVVVELFTSQGCSACPPADALLGELASRSDVIALALHVDYWDYIGWKDKFADPAHTARQKGYAYAAGHRTIYTPQMIVGGLAPIVGYKPMKLADLIQQQQAEPAPVLLQIARNDAGVALRAEAVAPIGPSEVVVIRLRTHATVDVRRGENAGKTLTYHNIVTDLAVVATWDGAAPLDMAVTVSGEDAAVVLVQRADHGAILAAARVP